MARDIELAVVAADDAFKDSGLQTRSLHRIADDQFPPFWLQYRSGPDQRRLERAQLRNARLAKATSSTWAVGAVKEWASSRRCGC